MSSQVQNALSYSQAIDGVIASGDNLLSSLSRDEKDRTFELNKLVAAVDVLHAETLASKDSPSQAEMTFLTATSEMRGGYLLIAAGRAVETGDRAAVQAALDPLRAERAEIDTGERLLLFFEADLLQTPAEAPTDDEALEAFKRRAGRTLDNMVLEARDVVNAALNNFKDKFGVFVDELGNLAKSFSTGGSGIIRSGVDKVLSGLKALMEFVKSDTFEEALDRLKEMVKDLDLEHVLAKAFACDKTKQTIAKLQLQPARNKATLRDAGTRMADLASRYVDLLKNARWLLKAVGLVGGLLVITGVAAQYAALGVPIAYALIALATVIIGIHFARSGMGGVIASL